MISRTRLLFAATAALTCVASMGAVNIKVEHTPRGQVSPDTPFTIVPPPSADDAATNAVFSVVDGVASKLANAGKLDKLHDGKMPPTEDAPAQNFFFEFATIPTIVWAVNVRCRHTTLMVPFLIHRQKKEPSIE